MIILQSVIKFHQFYYIFINVIRYFISHNEQTGMINDGPSFCCTTFFIYMLNQPNTCFFINISFATFSM